MPKFFTVSVEKDSNREEVSELVLTDAVGTTWRKRYFGNLFLLFDAQALGLILQAASSAKAKARRTEIASEAVLDEEMLRKMQFTKDQSPA